MDILLSILGLIIAWFVISNFLQSSKLNSTVDSIMNEIKNIKPHIKSEGELINFIKSSNRILSEDELLDIRWTNSEIENFIFNYNVGLNELTVHGINPIFSSFHMIANYTDDGTIIHCQTFPTFHNVSNEAFILATRLNIRGKILKHLV